MTLVKQIEYIDPVAAFAPLSHLEGSLLLHSANYGSPSEMNRYSFIAAYPWQILTSKNGKNKIEQDGTKVQEPIGNPFDIVKNSLALYPVETMEGYPPWQGGVAGLFSYDLGQSLETLPKPKVDDMAFPDMALGYYDVVAAYDHFQQRAWIFSTGYPETDFEKQSSRAHARMEYFENSLGREAPPTPRTSLCFPPVSNFTRHEYEKAIRKMVDYIYAGDIFEANMTRRLLSRLPEDLTAFELFQRLMAVNPAPFSAYLNFGKMKIASSSPERFLKLSQGKVETRPIKGTQRRSSDPDVDKALGQALLQSEKDRAENIMIVDLMRNDLSRVCKPGTVKTPELLSLETYATVHHLVSTVTGHLSEGQGAVELLKATFPGGSITGAPKIRAMEIIAELEPTARGPYCGSIGYIGFDGTMDTSIVIRTFALNGNIITFQAGGAIVADSVASSEYDETQLKASALIRALGYVPEENATLTSQLELDQAS